MTPVQAKRLVTRLLQVHGIGPRLSVHRAHYLADDRRPTVYVRESIPPVAETAVRLTFPEVRVIFTHTPKG